ncbi:FG-GAP repeat protein, partial [Candidatus Sumerlaeota bacterium]|nr:FG-GAP repeat protein [Candidatus Sumerlaeota bacterium]
MGAERFAQTEARKPTGRRPWFVPSTLIITAFILAANLASSQTSTLVSGGPQIAGYFGFSVSGIPDLNGDGFGDVMVGAYMENTAAPPPTTDNGRVYIFNGNTGAQIRAVTSPNREDLGTFGNSVGGIPDLTGDGRGDYIIGARREDGGFMGAGRAYVYNGSTGALL